MNSVVRIVCAEYDVYCAASYVNYQRSFSFFLFTLATKYLSWSYMCINAMQPHRRLNIYHCESIQHLPTPLILALFWSSSSSS